MLRDWKFNLGVNIDRRGPTAVYLQLAHSIIDEIRRGRLPAGSVLPGSRELALAINVNRKTIINAYDELIAQGWLRSDGTKGTFVSSTLPAVPAKPFTRHRTEQAALVDGPQFRNLTTSNEIPALFSEPGTLCLDDGTPDTRLFPVESFARAYRGSLTQAGRMAKLGYGDPRGSPQLRRAISKMLNVERGLATTPETICLTRGSQMAIYIASQIMIKPGDAVVVEQLTYPPARETFKAAGAEIIQVRLDENGLDVHHLEMLCRKHRVRLIYLTPNHQFPTTVLLRPDRRLRLLALAEQFGFAVVEDDYDHEFHFMHQPILPLTSADPGKVIYIGSMSKLLAPNLRLGYMAAPAKLIERAAKEILLLDRQGDQATENAIAELIDSGEVRRHARKTISVYATRRERFAALLQSELGDVVNFRLPDGGLAFWITFNDPEVLQRLEDRTEVVGLRFLPSGSFSGDGSGPTGIRLGFASLNDVEMNEAIRRLKTAIRG